MYVDEHMRYIFVHCITLLMKVHHHGINGLKEAVNRFIITCSCRAIYSGACACGVIVLICINFYHFCVGCERDVVHRMNQGYRACGTLKSVLSNRGLGIKAKKCLYEGVIVPTALYGAEAWGMRSAGRRKVNVLEMKCL